MVEEADGLEVLDADHLADRPLVEQPPHEPRVGRVAQHVRDGGDHAGALRRLRDRHALRLGGRERLLDQQVVALPGERDRGLRVLPVERGDDRRVGDLPARDRLAPVGEAQRRLDAVGVGERLAAVLARLGHGDDPRPLRVPRGPAGERRAARAAAGDQQLDGRHQKLVSAVSICSWPFLSASSGLIWPPIALLTFVNTACEICE